MKLSDEIILKIVDTFTEEIVKNFDFSYVLVPNFGTISETIDEETNSSMNNATGGLNNIKLPF